MMTRENNRDCHPQGVPLQPAEAVFRFAMHVGDESGYDQFDPDFEGTVEELPLEDRLSDYYTGDFLCSKRMSDTMMAAGADNLELFTAEIEDAQTRERLAIEYRVLNPLGAMRRSTVRYEKDGPAVLELDPHEVRGLHVFRPASTHSEVVICEAIAVALRAAPELKGFAVEELRVEDVTESGEAKA